MKQNSHISQITWQSFLCPILTNHEIAGSIWKCTDRLCVRVGKNGQQKEI
uniref:Uncharacterized protein n=1 Tax=Rhizophora mucronata TaxID=61149 RepID=A0A2P2KHW8_RHIMU